MSQIFRIGLVAAVSLAPFTVAVNSCEAGPILDWLLGRRRAFFRGGATTCCSPSTQVARRVVVNYAPQTCYRNRWLRVPVTVYRPTTTVDPVTGCQVTCMRPCTTYKWQAQRVAVTVMRPVYSTVVTDPCNSCTPTRAATTSNDDDYYNRSRPRAETKPRLPVDDDRAKAGGASTQRSLLRGARNVWPRRGLRPIPDPANRRALQITPKLIHSRDRTAAYYPVRRAWAATPIRWQDVVVKPVTVPAAALVTKQAIPLPTGRIRRLDDRGWRSE